uniref:Small ribosomal subunit protein bS16c n=1 Tax=Prasinoderma coloniale TaxID=156133 RepID=A0A088CJY4_9VIRI|nr:ribosomal protein S16 [Prasinoderma coloniale]AID67562.1 ribosomal protein S16 [Prasinoderma coloniale]
MVKIRLKKLGRKKAPFYRIIAIDSRKRRNGRGLAEIGWYDPIKKQSQIDRQKTLFYLQNGAQPTATVSTLLQKAALL